jgi:hypothetical protein
MFDFEVGLSFISVRYCNLHLSQLCSQNPLSQVFCSAFMSWHILIDVTRLDNRGTWVRFHGGARDISLPPNVQTSPVAMQPSLRWVLRAHFAAEKRHGRKGDCSPRVSSAEVENE